MIGRSGLSVVSVVVMIACHASALAQELEVKRYNYAEWAKGRFSEVVTVTGPGKTIYLAGVGAEDETGPFGAIRHPGNFLSNAATPTIKFGAISPRTAPATATW